MMDKIIAVVALIVSVVVSWNYCEGYWVVGPVFAAALLLANYRTVLNQLSWKHALFLIGSTLTYALVCWIATKGGWKFQNDWLDGFFGSLSAGVVLGSVLMPAFHARLFGIESKRIRATSTMLLLSWFATVLLSCLDESTGLDLNVNYMFVSIALWQGIYFLNLDFNRKD